MEGTNIDRENILKSLINLKAKIKLANLTPEEQIENWFLELQAKKNTQRESISLTDLVFYLASKEIQRKISLEETINKYNL